MLKSLICGVLFMALFAVAPIWAEDKPAAEAASDVVLKEDFGSKWHNGGPLAVANLKGKLLVLFFFTDTTCPKCMDRWSGRELIRRKYEGEPVEFVGVISGVNYDKFKSHVKRLKCDWAFYADVDKHVLKQLLGVDKIDLGSEFAGVIKPDGTFKRISINLDDDVRKELVGAKWKIDPKDVPTALKKAWRQYEFGQFAECANGLTEFQDSSDGKIKDCAAKMNAGIHAEAGKFLEQSKAQLAADKKWAAFNTYESIALYFKGLPEATEAAAALENLKKDKAVQKELNDRAMREKIQEWANTTRKSEQ